MANILTKKMSEAAVSYVKLHGYELWRSLGSPVHVVAPMVDASALAFRLLTRQYGAQLCYTPMIHARMTVESAGYLDSTFSTTGADRPLIAQLCGNDPDTVLAAARKVLQWKPAVTPGSDAVVGVGMEAHAYPVDAIDLNLGCPQGIARRGHYGAFLLEETDTIVAIVRKLAENLPVPVTVKVRILPRWEDTIRTVLALQSAGAAVITVHGRTRFNMKQSITCVDWETIQRITSHPEVKVPIIANGGIAHAADVPACLAATGAVAVMTSEGILENPGLFSRQIHTTTGARASVIDLAEQYIALAKATGTDRGMAKGHVLKLLHGVFTKLPALRQELQAGWPWTWEGFDHVVARVREAVADIPPAFLPDGRLNDAHPEYANLLKWEEAWREQRAASPTIGLSHPAFKVDPREPGLWYMRHRDEMFEETKPPIVEEGIEERLAAFKAARRASLEATECAVGGLFGGEEEEFECGTVSCGTTA